MSRRALRSEVVVLLQCDRPIPYRVCSFSKLFHHQELRLEDYVAGRKGGGASGGLFAGGMQGGLGTGAGAGAGLFGQQQKLGWF